MTDANDAKDTKDANLASGKTREYLTMQLGGQMFGIPVLQVQDVLGEQKVTRVPLARPEIVGSLNLRGRIVTAISLRKRLGLPAAPEGQKSMSVVVDHQESLYSLIVDGVGEVLPLAEDGFEKTPATLDPVWREHATGIYRLKDTLLVILDVPKMLESLCVREETAA